MPDLEHNRIKNINPTITDQSSPPTSKNPDPHIKATIPKIKQRVEIENRK